MKNVHHLTSQTPSSFSSFPWRKCKYGGDDEYHVHVRETGNHKQNVVNTESREETSQDSLGIHN